MVWECGLVWSYMVEYMVRGCYVYRDVWAAALPMKSKYEFKKKIFLHDTLPLTSMIPILLCRSF